MAISDDVKSGVDGVLLPAWDERDGTVVPKTEDIALKNGAVNLEATYLYADMADSTGLAQNYKKFAVAKIVRCYLNAASRLINHYGGEIRSFDGDRVMGIFVGGRKNTNSVRCALAISWAVSQVIDPKIKEKWSDVTWTMKHGVGIDTGEAMLVRGGVRGDNDIVSIGSAPNIAAKLSEQRGYSINISSEVFSWLLDEVKLGPKGESMWSKAGTANFGGKSVAYYGSTWYWSP